MCAWWNRLVEKMIRTPGAAGVDDIATPASGPPEAARDRERRRRVTLGLDFGTSSTKCCFKEESDGKPFHFVAHDREDQSSSPLLLPSAVAIEDGRMYFGFEAEHRTEARSVRSFKMCLLCQAQAESGRTASVPCNRCLREQPGFFDLDGYRLSAEDISTLYLSALLGQALARVPSALSAHTDQIRVHVNSAAPLDQMSEFGPVGEYFDRVVFYAHRLAARAHQGWSVAEASRALAEVRIEPKPAIEQSPTRVFPETHAAITGYLLLPESEKGLYGLVDIGAGTTDVAFFWLQKDERVTKAWYYAAGSRRVGMDDVDRAMEPVLDPRAGDLRRLREALSDKQLASHSNLLDPVARRMHQHYAAILREAMTVDQRDWAWRHNGVAKFGLFLVGGGARCGPVTGRFEEVPAVGSQWQRPPELLSVPSGSRVSMPDGSLTTLKAVADSTAASLLLLAYGLAHPRPDIPPYDRDRDGVPKPPTPDRGPTPEELYGHA